MKKEVPKELVVVDSYTVANPRAMVIHAHNAAVANTAVVGARWADVVALEAVAPPDDIEDAVREVLVDLFLDLTPRFFRHVKDLGLEHVHVLNVDALFA